MKKKKNTTKLLGTAKRTKIGSEIIKTKICMYLLSIKRANKFSELKTRKYQHDS